MRVATFLGVISVILAGCGGGGGGGGGGASGGGSAGGSGTGGGSGPPTVTLSAQPASIAYGGSTTLTWSSSRASSCEASNAWSGPKPLSGSETVTNLVQNRTFELRCTSGTGAAVAAITVIVNIQPPTLEITSSPELARRGAPVTVTWKASGADKCSAGWDNGRERPTQGTEQVTNAFLEDRVRFLFSCTGGGTSVERFIGWDTLRLSGDVVIPRGLSMDNDVNDPQAGYSSNDSTMSPDIAPSQGVISGYVNRPMSGPPGRSYEQGDEVDYYLTGTMLAGQVIRLILPTVDPGEPAATRPDADLYLYDLSDNLIDASLGDGPLEILTIPREDAYYLAVVAVNGAMNYHLSIEAPAPAAVASAERIQGDFVPGEAIVLPRRGASVDVAGRLRGKGGVPVAGALRKAGMPDRQMLVSIPLRATVPAHEKPGTMRHGAQGAAALSDVAQQRLSTLLALKDLRRQPGIEAATVNSIVHAQAFVPNDPFYARQRWHYGLAQIPAAWATTVGVPGVTVAVVDSGALRDHPDLASQWTDGFDFVRDPGGLDGDGLDADFNDPGFNAAGRWLFHGTHVAGTVGALGNNGIGGTGVAPGVRLMPLRALDGREGTLYDVLQAVRYAAGLPNDSGLLPSRPADVINLSLGSASPCDAVTAGVMSQVTSSGVAVVAAAGNSGAATVISPANCPGVVSVAALDGNGSLAPYSNWGDGVDVAAPGGNLDQDVEGDGFADGVFSTHGSRSGGVMTFTYDALQGTSMATPHVAGIYALMKSVKPDLVPAYFTQLLENGLITQRIGNPSLGTVASGAINAQKAVDAALGIFPSDPILGLSPTTMNFGSYLDSLTFEVWNAGSGVLALDSLQSSVPWAEVRPILVDGAGLGRYEVRVSREAIASGNREGRIDIRSSAGTRSIYLLISTYPYNVQSALGRQRVRLIDGATGQVVEDLPVSLTGDRVRYKFYNAMPGNYVVLAGTDMNNDGDICDPGEICGAFPVGSLPEAFDYKDLLEGIDVPIGLTAAPSPGAAGGLLETSRVR